MRYGSVCSGIEAASVAWEPLGWQPAWFAEIEPFPAAVLAHHWPQVTNLGDMTTISRKVLLGSVEAPDVLVGGTPCQAFSVAGAREGLSDDRGQLTIAYGRLADAIDYRRTRDGKPESIIVWENVPGVLSSKDNAFGCFLALLAGDSEEIEPAPRPESGRNSAHWRWCKKTGQHIPKWPNAGCVAGPQRTVAWRVMDAQYFGVAQRRRRVFVVASARSGFDPAAVLFEFDGVRRDSAPSREAGQETAGTLASRTGAGGFPGTDEALSGYVTPVLMAHGQGGAEISVGRAPTLTCNHEAPILGEAPMLAFSCKDYGNDVGPVSPPLRAMNGVSGRPNGGGQVAVCYHTTGAGFWQEGAGTLRARSQDSHENLAVAFAENSRGEVRLENGDGQVCGALSTGGGKPGQGTPAVAFRACGQEGFTPSPIAPPVMASDGGGAGVPSVFVYSRVRRLMPVECERLQGFPDGHTQIPWSGKSADNCPDGPRYKAIGNSKAIPAVQWLGVRIDMFVRQLEVAA